MATDYSLHATYSKLVLYLIINMQFLISYQTKVYIKLKKSVVYLSRMNENIALEYNLKRVKLDNQNIVLSRSFICMGLQKIPALEH